MSAVPGFSLDLPSARGPVSIKIDDINGVTIIHSARTSRASTLPEPKPQTVANPVSTAAHASSNSNANIQGTKNTDSHAAPTVVDPAVTQLTTEHSVELSKFKLIHDPQKNKENKLFVEELQSIHHLELELLKKYKINIVNKISETNIFSVPVDNVNMKKSIEHTMTADKVFPDGVPGYLSARKKATMLHLKFCALLPIRYKSVSPTNKTQSSQSSKTSIRKFADGEAERLKSLFDVKSNVKLSEEHMPEITNALKASLATALGILILYQEHYQYRLTSKSTQKTETYIRALLNGFPIERDQMENQNANSSKKKFASNFRDWEDCMEKIESSDSCVIA
jgi:hypothetical protein